MRARRRFRLFLQRRAAIPRYSRRLPGNTGPEERRRSVLSEGERRTALLPAPVACDTPPGLGLHHACGVGGGRGKLPGRAIESCGVMVSCCRGRSRREHRAAAPRRSKGAFVRTLQGALSLRHGHHAVVRALASAACRKRPILSAARRKQGRDQREVEHEQQQNEQESPHGRCFQCAPLARKRIGRIEILLRERDRVCCNLFARRGVPLRSSARNIGCLYWAVSFASLRTWIGAGR